MGIVAGLALLGAAHALASAPALTPDDLDRLSRGEILFRAEVPVADGALAGNGGTAVMVLEADPETVWRILTDFDHYAGLFPRLKESEVLHRDGGAALVLFRVGVGPFNFRFFVTHLVSREERQISWRLERSRANDLFEDTWGYWRLEPLPGGRLLVTYAMGSRTVLPAFLTRGSEQDSVLQTVAALRTRVERVRRAEAGSAKGA